MECPEAHAVPAGDEPVGPAVLAGFHLRRMAAADRLWGVTMQESGISRLLPMRFEDWPDEADSPENVAA